MVMSSWLEASPGESGAQPTGQASLPWLSQGPRSPGIHPFHRRSPKDGESMRLGTQLPLTRVRGHNWVWGPFGVTSLPPPSQLRWRDHPGVSNEHWEAERHSSSSQNCPP